MMSILCFLIPLSAVCAVAAEAVSGARGGVSSTVAAGAAARGAAQKPELCGVPLMPFLRPMADVQFGRQRTVLGAGSFGMVELGTLDGAPVIAKISQQTGAEAELSTTVELIGGMSVCSDFVPCPPTTPVVSYLGGAVSKKGRLTTVLLEPVLAPPSSKPVDLATVLDPTAAQAEREAWTAYAGGVSPWLPANLFPTFRNLDAVLVAVQQMLLGLDVIEARGMRHCDVKPDNMMFGADYTVKIVDIGIPCFFEQSASDKVRQPPGQLAGPTSIVSGGRATEQQRTSQNVRKRLTCRLGMRQGTYKYMSPTMFLMDRNDKDTWESCCLLNAACNAGKKSPTGLQQNKNNADMFQVGLLESASIDTYAIGAILFDFLLAQKGAIHSISPMISQTKSEVVWDATQRSVRIARFLALEEFGDDSPSTHVQRTAELRPRVRARATLLVSAALQQWKQTANSISTTISTSGDISPPIFAAGFTKNSWSNFRLCWPSLTPSGSQQSYTSYFREVCGRNLANGYAIGAISGTGDGKNCDVKALKNFEDAIVKGLAMAPGTAALMDLLANLLSPGIRPGLATADLTIGKLADSIDDVRSKLYEQRLMQMSDAKMGPVSDEAKDAMTKAKDGLGNFLAAVNSCIATRSEEAQKAKWSHGELSAICRSTDPAAAAVRALAAARNAAWLLSKRIIRAYIGQQQLAAIFAYAEAITASNVEYSLAFSTQAPTFAKSSAPRILVARMGTAAAGGSDANAAAAKDVFLDAFAPAAGKKPAKRISSRQLLRVGDAFKKAKGDKAAAFTLMAQAELCSEFIAKNTQSVDSQPNGLINTVANRIGDRCGGNDPQRDARCYCFAVRASKGRIKVVRVLSDDIASFGAFIGKVKEQTQKKLRLPNVGARLEFLPNVGGVM